MILENSLGHICIDTFTDLNKSGAGMGAVVLILNIKL
jgi:hypothetical protein